MTGAQRRSPRCPTIGLHPPAASRTGRVTRVRARTGLVGSAAVLLVLAGCSSSDGAGPDRSSSANGSSDAAVASSTTLGCSPPASGEQTVEVGGVERTFDVYVPDDLRSPAPLLVLFHGFASSKEEMATKTGLDRSAPAAGVVLVVPQGAGDPAGWNVITGFEEDSAFIDAVLAPLDAEACIDSESIWLAGFSAGSAFSAVYGCFGAERFAGLGLTAGLPPPICPPDATPQVVVVHGTDDLVVPYGGGDQAVGDTAVPLGAVPDSVAGWAERAGCQAEPLEGAAGADVQSRTWNGCAGGSSVALLTVQGGGHAWPGSVEPMGFGPTSQTFSDSCVLLASIVEPGVDHLGDCPGEGRVEAEEG